MIIPCTDGCEQEKRFFGNFLQDPLRRPDSSLHTIIESGPVSRDRKAAKKLPYGSAFPAAGFDQKFNVNILCGIYQGFCFGTGGQKEGAFLRILPQMAQETVKNQVK